MTTYKRVAGNLIVETTGATDTITFQGPTANATTLVINGNLTVSGNATLSGNISGDKLFNGTTSIEIQTLNGNANVTVGGTSNVAVFANTGMFVTGIVSATGNVVAGNLVGNVGATGNIVVNYTSDATNLRVLRFADANTVVTTLGSNIGAVEWFTNDATGAGPRVTARIQAVYSDNAGNANLQIQTGSSATPTTRITILGATGNVGVANSAPLHTFAVSGNTYTSGNASVIGNVSGGNALVSGLISATGNITGGNVSIGGLATVTGNVTAGNVISLGLVSAGAAGVSATGNVTGGNLLSQGIISATGNLTTTDIFASSLSASGNVQGANLVTAGVANTGSVTASTTVSAAGNITGGNLLTAGTVTATSNIQGGNLRTVGQVSATGNITGNFFIGDGGLLSNITAVSNVAVSQLANGVTNLTVRSSTGPITADVNGVANVINITDTTFTSNIALNVSANVTGGNLFTTGIVSATGNITGGNVSGTIGNFGTVIGLANASNLTTGTVPSDRLTGGYTININGFATTVSDAAQPNITSVGIMSALSVNGNINAGNLRTAGLISATGNVTGNFFLGNGSQLTGIDATSIQNGTSNVRVVSSGGNVAIGVGGTSNIAVFATTGTFVTGVASATGNIISAANVSGGNILTGGLISATGVVFSSGINSSGNIVGSNLNAAGLSLSGNVVSALSMVTNITTTANVTGGNILTGGLISATGNITGGNILGGANVNATLFTGTTVSVTGNITGGNISTAGNLAAPTAPQNTNTTQVATTAFVLGQTSAATPLAIAAAGSTGLASTFARADHTHSGVTSITGTGDLYATASAGAVILSLPQNINTSAAVQFGSITITTGNITLGNIVNGGANLSGNIGSATGYFNTVFAKATSAQYADLAEKFVADQLYLPGTVLIFGGSAEVTESVQDADSKVAGVVSTNPSYLMNSGLDHDFSVEVALQGRVPCFVTGPVEKGDLMVSAAGGRARAVKTAQAGTIIGKSLENFQGEHGTIEIVVGRC